MLIQQTGVQYINRSVCLAISSWISKWFNKHQKPNPGIQLLYGQYQDSILLLQKEISEQMKNNEIQHQQKKL